MINIAVDGYSGSGKGELCKGLSKKLNLKHLDTGAILRGMGLYFYNKGITEVTEDLVDEHFDNLNITVEFDGDVQHTYLNGEDVSTAIRMEAIGQMASKVAAIKRAMEKLIQISQDFASKYDCILDGRNITSEVLPNADVKFFLDASLECRANRRYAEDVKKNKASNFEEVKKSLAERDYRDTHRSFSPMILTPDSVKVDNTNMGIEETIEYCYSVAVEKLNKSRKI